MTVFILWFLVGFIALSVLLMINSIGKRREPVTPGVAILSIVFWSFFVFLGVIPAAIALA